MGKDHEGKPARKGILLSAAALFVLLSAGGCAFKPSLAVVSPAEPRQFWQAVKTGAEKAAKDFAVEVTFEEPAAQEAAGDQTRAVQSALNRQPDALLLAAVDSQALAPLLERADATGVLVIGIDSGVDSEIPFTTVATDDVTAAALAADMLAERIGGSGKVAMILPDDANRAGPDRRKGFLLRMEDRHPGIAVVAVRHGGGDRHTAAAAVRGVLLSHPNLEGIFCASEAAAVGAVRAVQELGREGRVVVVGFDAGKEQIAAIRAGAQAGAVTRDPLAIGYKGVEAAVRVLNCELVPKRIRTGFFWYDKTNMDTDLIRPLLYE